MKIIDFEAHFYTKSCLNYMCKRDKYPRFVAASESGSYNIEFSKEVVLYHGKPCIDKLLDIGTGRIAAMDQAGVTLQILSLTTPSLDITDPNNDLVSLVQEANDELFAAIQQNPTRLKGFAALATDNIPAAAKELERAISKLGFVGWLTHSNLGDGKYLDDKSYWPLFEAAQSLQVPIYLHPMVPGMKEFGKYGITSAGPALGFQFDTALCLMRMILAGVFDEFPHLKIILGHLGETMPFLMERLDFSYTNEALGHEPEFVKIRPKIKKLPSEVLRENVYVATSGRFYHPVLEYTVQAMGADSVLFASDYPYESLPKSVNFIKESKLSNDIIQKICIDNAGEFF